MSVKQSNKACNQVNGWVSTMYVEKGGCGKQLQPALTLLSNCPASKLTKESPCQPAHHTTPISLGAKPMLHTSLNSMQK